MSHSLGWSLWEVLSYHVKLVYSKGPLANRELPNLNLKLYFGTKGVGLIRLRRRSALVKNCRGTGYEIISSTCRGLHSGMILLWWRTSSMDGVMTWLATTTRPFVREFSPEVKSLGYPQTPRTRNLVSRELQLETFFLNLVFPTWSPCQLLP